MANKNTFSKEFWYVSGAIVVIALLAWVFLRDSNSTSTAIIDTNQQASSTVVSGTGATTGLGKLPTGWPADAPVLQANASIQYAGPSNPKTKAVGPTVIYVVQGAVQNTITYYKSQFTKHGWTFRGQGNAEGSVMLAATKDKRRLSVSILETHPGTLSVTIGITQ